MSWLRHFEEILLAFATIMPALWAFFIQKPRSGDIMVEKGRS
jgi:hypothetical protein